MRVVQGAAEALRKNPEDTAAATRWRQGVIASLVCGESIALFGLTLRFRGGLERVRDFLHRENLSPAHLDAPTGAATNLIVAQLVPDCSA